MARYSPLKVIHGEPVYLDVKNTNQDRLFLTNFMKRNIKEKEKPVQRNWQYKNKQLAKIGHIVGNVQT